MRIKPDERKDLYTLAAQKTDPRFERALVENSYGEAIHDVVKSEPIAAPG